ncbi:hypothetical protein Cflav_PD1797 [Pedosphaera parvula Ellin514]|uniref:Uncharacterized protein n=2 Tax=Pedosphaera TaxID=1032526 RepID=B9XN39_PEDPL|nr:hypothetical protein Cflav_PD1797 [Pedosphaera parvula Ellin514]
MIEVSSKKWKEFCQRINDQLGGATVTIEIIQLDGRQIEVGRDLTFDRVEFIGGVGCNDTISVRAKGIREVKHEIIEPIHIRLRQVDDSGTFNSIAIEAENGTSFLTFHPAIHAQMLEGLNVT